MPKVKDVFVTSYDIGGTDGHAQADHDHKEWIEIRSMGETIYHGEGDSEVVFEFAADEDGATPKDMLNWYKAMQEKGAPDTDTSFIGYGSETSTYDANEGVDLFA